MALAIVGTIAEDLEDGGGTATINRTVTAGNALLAILNWAHNTAVINSVTCSGESNLTLVGTTATASIFGTPAHVRFAVLPEITAGGSKTIRANWSAGLTGSGSITIVELSGQDVAAFVNAVANAAANGAPSLNLSTTVDGAAIFAICKGDFDMNADTAAGYTAITPYSAINSFDAAEYDLDVGTAGSKAVTFTSFGNYVMAAIAIKPAGGGGGDITGSTSAAFSASGALTGTGALSGAVSAAFSASGSMAGIGELAGSSALSFSSSAALTGTGALSGSSAIGFSASSTLTGTGNLSGTASFAFGSSGTFDAPSGALSGAVTLAITASGQLSGAGALSGISAASFAPSSFLAGLAPFAGSSAIVISVNGVLTDAALLPETPRRRTLTVRKVSRVALQAKTDRSTLVLRRNRLH